MGLRMKDFNIFGVHWKIWFLGGVCKKPIELWQFADLRWGLRKKEGGGFLRKGGGEADTQCTLWFILNTNNIDSQIPREPSLGITISLKFVWVLPWYDFNLVFRYFSL